ncbi:MAG: LacI family transcriptional regulator [Calditrichaeota bacterium]|nr:LacI family transcriptional regulator [Calditrichota bacterium]
MDNNIRTSEVSKIFIGNFQGVQLAVIHLVKIGHHQIACVGREITHPSIYERLRDYRDTLQEHNLPNDKLNFNYIKPSTGLNDGYEAIRKLFWIQELPLHP